MLAHGIVSVLCISYNDLHPLNFIYYDITLNPLCDEQFFLLGTNVTSLPTPTIPIVEVSFVPDKNNSNANICVYHCK